VCHSVPSEGWKFSLRLTFKFASQQSLGYMSIIDTHVFIEILEKEELDKIFLKNFVVRSWRRLWTLGVTLMSYFQEAKPRRKGTRKEKIETLQAFLRRVIFWNSNGLKDPKTHMFLSDFSREQQLCFIAVSETGRKFFNDAVLRNLCGGKNCLWHCKEPWGRSGGILLGIDLDIFDIGAIDEGGFYVKFHLCNKENNFKWVLVAIHGPAQSNLTEQLLTEMVHMCSHEQLQILIGGDFNILRNPCEKTNDNFKHM
jgi:hypothetical protein